MKVITPGHTYEAENFDNPNSSQTIQFIHKDTSDQDGQMMLVSDGTTNEELLKILIDRMNYLQSKKACRENAIAITNLEQALMWMEKRTMNRIARGVEGTNLA